MTIDRELTEAERQQNAQAIQKTGRSCGDCTMCCNLFTIPELNKPAGVWCEHCRSGKGGCAIYANRPQRCRNFVCQWLVNPDLGDEWMPKRARIVVAFDGESVNFKVDPKYPNRWREEPYIDLITDWVSRGYKVNVDIGPRCFEVSLEPPASGFQGEVEVLQVSGGDA
jgi:hypothetical protein